ncbi:MAG: hypothetical protein ACK4HE_11165 [Chitinophagaceae bacterium]
MSITSNHIDWASFRQLPTREAAEALVALLAANHLPVRVQEQKPHLDKVYVGEIFESPFHVLLPTTHFAAAEHVLASQHNDQPLPKEFTDYTAAEWQQIIEAPFSWSAEVYAYALRQMQSQGYMYTDEALNHYKQQALRQMATPKKANTVKLTLSWLFAASGVLFLIWWPALSFALGVVSSLGGAILLYSTKTLPNGTIVQVYDAGSVQSGRWLLLLGSVATLVGLTLLLISVS